MKYMLGIFAVLLFAGIARAECVVEISTVADNTIQRKTICTSIETFEIDEYIERLKLNKSREQFKIDERRAQVEKTDRDLTQAEALKVIVTVPEDPKPEEPAPEEPAPETPVEENP